MCLTMFELQVRMTSPMTHEEDLDRVLVEFLNSIGYIKYTSKDFDAAKKSVGYRLFKECFLLHSSKLWNVDELIAYLNTSRPTLYRYLNKLKSLDLLEEEHEGISKKYRLRFGNFKKAWSFVEANVKLAMENYAKSVEHIQKLAEGEI